MVRSVRKFFLTSSLVTRYKGEDRRVENRKKSRDNIKAWQVILNHVAMYRVSR